MIMPVVSVTINCEQIQVEQPRLVTAVWHAAGPNAASNMQRKRVHLGKRVSSIPAFQAANSRLM